MHKWEKPNGNVGSHIEIRTPLRYFLQKYYWSQGCFSTPMQLAIMASRHFV